MLTLFITHHKNSNNTVLKLKGEGTVIITQIFQDNVRQVAKYIKMYEPDKIKCNYDDFALSVTELLKKMY